MEQHAQAGRGKVPNRKAYRPPVLKPRGRIRNVLEGVVQPVTDGRRR